MQLRCMWLLASIASLFLQGVAMAGDSCFLVKERGSILKNEGDCDTAYPPASTFKIPLSLMGFDSDILRDEEHPLWSRPEESHYYINICKGEHYPATWMRDSCLWYSQILTSKLGIKKFEKYITSFAYGNMNITGDSGKDNGLTQSWISSSLKISPNQQADFLQKMVAHAFHVSAASYASTKKIMFIQEMPGGWKLYGKTGNDRVLDDAGQKTELQHGWFVGYIEKGNRTIVFVNHLVDKEKQSTFASLRARNDAWTKLWYLINEIEK